jgi:hypothetical protein
LLVSPRAYSRRKHLKGAPIGLALALPSNSKTRLERVSKEKPSSLLGLVISDEGKKFYKIDTSSEELFFIDDGVQCSRAGVIITIKPFCRRC